MARMTSVENIQRLCLALDSLADARANLAVVNYQIKKGELLGVDPEDQHRDVDVGDASACRTYSAGGFDTSQSR
jgi:hypothetical protein